MTSRQVLAPPDGQVLGRALLPLRAFLGFTFCFAGLQKLANPRFFDAADPASIQVQLAGAARRSPVHALISPLTHIAVPPGISQFNASTGAVEVGRRRPGERDNDGQHHAAGGRPLLHLRAEGNGTRRRIVHPAGAG